MKAIHAETRGGYGWPHTWTLLHSTLAYVSAMRFEQDWLAAQAKQANS